MKQLQELMSYIKNQKMMAILAAVSFVAIPPVPTSVEVDFFPISINLSSIFFTTLINFALQMKQLQELMSYIENQKMKV